MGVVFLRELRSYFQNLVGFIFMGFFLLVSGVFFVLANLIPGSPNFNGFLNTINFIFLIVVPVLTMRLLPEEARQKTDLLLITSPLSLTAIVLGKFFAALAIFFMTLIITIVYPVIIGLVGEPAVAQIIGGYIGFFLLGAAFISVGLFISSLTENQVIAAVVTFAVLLCLWLIDLLQQGLPGDQLSGVVFAGMVVAGIALYIFFTMRSIVLAIAGPLPG